ncbi:hypothetical protein NEOLEDRAFT_1142097 [Neolentinus lepideus HHB14362 ss-1]|uniref:Uncharacterized protein n=1 Tax=Neolentinus lepideus HHB14362 ss-1 TaxID=1314782 RepID=A0A165NBG0_9AGAM|nr:hypothetical protein NEOLEDRAFT_1142097 [Neolentinus lepideus HHB14362 ss-1]
MGDILSASASLLLHLCTTFTHLSSHTQTIRTNMKSIRTREESLLALNRRHKSLQSKCESADKKLSKMNPENKNVQAQMDLINKLREEIKDVEGEILAEEAALGDYKRVEVKEWMGIQFGGIGECGEVAVLIAHYGKLLIEAIPLGRTEPGLARTMYTGQDQTRSLTQQADDAIRRVEFSTFPLSSLPSFPSSGGGMNAPTDRYQSPDRRQSIYAPSPLPPPTHPSMLSSSSPASSMPEPYSTTSSFPPPPAHPQLVSTNSTRSRPSSGLNWNIPGLSSDSRNDNYSLDPIQTGNGLGLGEFIDAPADEFGVSNPSSARSTSRTVSIASGPSSSSGARQGGRFATFPVKRRGTVENAKEAEARESRRSEESQSAEGLPAYTPLDLNLGGGLQVELLNLNGNGVNQRREEDEDNVELAYMSPTAESPMSSPMHSRFGAVSEGSGAGAAGAGAGASAGRDDGLSVGRADRRLRFKSGATDIEEAMEKRAEAEREPQPSPNEDAANDRASTTSQPPEPQQPPERIPTPPSATETDEHSLNAAAAREISRELDALLFSPPAPAPSASRPTGPTSPTVGKVSTPENDVISPRLGVSQDQEQPARTPSPLAPPAPPFASNSPGVGQTNYAQANARRASMASSEKERGESPPLSPRAGQPLPSIPPVGQTQTSGSQPLPPPPTINLPNRSTTPISTATSTPYRTPPEYPRPSYSSLPRPNLASQSSSNLSSGGATSGPNSPLLPPAPGTKTISASAFRRQMRSPSASSVGSGGVPGVADTSPLSFVKRTLPTSPYPAGGGLRGRTGSASSGVDRSLPQLPPATKAEGEGEGGDDPDDQFDYISAYVNDSPEEPKRDGYGQGRFATNLDEGRT